MIDDIPNQPVYFSQKDIMDMRFEAERNTWGWVNYNDLTATKPWEYIYLFFNREIIAFNGLNSD